MSLLDKTECVQAIMIKTFLYISWKPASQTTSLYKPLFLYKAWRSTKLKIKFILALIVSKKKLYLYKLYPLLICTQYRQIFQKKSAKYYRLIAMLSC